LFAQLEQEKNMARTVPITAATAMPVGVTLPQAEALSGLSRGKLRKEIEAGRLDARKHGSTTVVLFRSLQALLEGLPRYVDTPTPPEAVKMLEGRRRRAARQRAAREELSSTAAE
jgi:hypothetical protein